MRETMSVCEPEDLRKRLKKEERCSECIRNTLPLRTVRTNGVVPHQSRVSCMPSVHPGTRELTKVLVTGGAGYMGHNLGLALAKLGYTVIFFDIHKPDWEVPSRATFIEGDIRDYDALYDICEGVDCVFHAASFGMSGYQQLQTKQIESINVGGTQVVIDVCIHRNIPRLVYTSTVNVVFGGNSIEDGTEETTTYYPLEKQLDYYSKTKTIAEQMILAANGSLLKGGGKLHTCVLRPPGIYGPDEKRHLPRLVANAEKGLLYFKFWNKETKMNWIHLYNLIDAHILAAEALTASKGYIASGKAYFIHDGEDVSFDDWYLHPIFEKLGFSDPWIIIPSSVAYAAAFILEYLYLILKPFASLDPVLTRHEVMKIVAMHTFRIDKAQKELGYNPKKFSMAESVDLYMKTRPISSQKNQNFVKLLLITFALLICILYLPLLLWNH
ncbi:putative short-chain dehydrogenase/reductase family 42E member 2 isoform X1 [Bufo gargarizans]|uniref:putative short-chain dehydrogenase/reductase family 42E member 2 isoform X1 n=1 Tax=Bufo gargarizans TaxID=30331 RepID=UPI001CF2A9CE|nr:putative short-chain dehydrogenase/reductase family 42E member 2 isoform X1 [Bufo gargarizans]